MSFGQDLTVEVVHEGVLVVVADGQGHIVFDDDMVLLDLADFVQIDDVRTVDAHEPQQKRRYSLMASM